MYLVKDSFFSYEELVPDLTVDHEVGARWIRIGQEHADPAATRCKFTETQPVTARHSIRPAPGSCALPGPCQARLCQCSRRMRLAASAKSFAADRALRAHAAPRREHDGGTHSASLRTSMSARCNVISANREVGLATHLRMYSRHESPAAGYDPVTPNQAH